MNNINKEKIINNKAILLVMDYQNSILEMFKNKQELINRMSDTIKCVRQKGIKVGYVWVAFSDQDYDKVPDNNPRFKEIATNRLMHIDNPEAQINQKLSPNKTDIVVRKTRTGAFSTTDLDKQLKDNNIDTLILAGLSTSGVVLSTIKDAADKDYSIYVLSDCCADPEEEIHQMLINKIFPRQANVITSKDLNMLVKKIES